MDFDIQDKRALAAFSNGEMTALELRRRLGGATYGEILERISAASLPLPRAKVGGRESDIEKAHAWMFPPHAA